MWSSGKLLTQLSVLGSVTLWNVSGLNIEMKFYLHKEPLEELLRREERRSDTESGVYLCNTLLWVCV